MERELEIHNEMLSDISDEYEKLPGSFIYDATRPTAIQLAKTDEQLEDAKKMLDVENRTGEALERWVFDRTGIERRQATYSHGLLEVTGNGIVNEGDLFETESGIQFIATETVEINVSGMVRIRSVISGTIGNVPANQINKIPVTLEGITAVTNPLPTIDGFEAENDDDLRSRYKERIRTPATSGNKYHYRNWAKEVAGVGEVRVFPLWNGDNTVKVVIIDADRKPASNELVQQVQEYIDPNASGRGEGQAPIGAYCTVESATGYEINIEFSVTKKDGYTDQDIINIVSQNITNHLKEIAFIQNIISYAQIGAIIFNSEGVIDYENLLVNGSNVNITLRNEQVAVLGGVTIV